MSLFVALAALAAPPPAAAPESARREPALGSRIDRRVDLDVWDTDKTRRVQMAFGECVIKKYLKTARHFVLTPNMEKSEWRKDVGKIADGFCLVAATDERGNVEMKFPVDTMRYALADALVRQEFASGPAPSIKDAAPLEAPKLFKEDYEVEPGRKPRKGELEELQQKRQKQVALIYLAAFGECVVRADPVTSHALLLADPGSPQEGAAFKKMSASFGGCMFAGQSLSFDKATLRGTIAMNYYRLAHAPKVSATPAGGTK